MLQSLCIKNYALIDELNVEFGRGLNIITGETGAGKSIVIDALSLALGERADSNAVRKGAEKAILEGVFTISRNGRLETLLKQNEIELSDTLILRREVSAKGLSRSFVNDSPVTLTVLKQVGDLLVDLHGQHEHQSLLRTETHIDLLDDFGGLEGLRTEFRHAYADAMQQLRAINELRSKEAQLRDRQALYEFQIREIDAVDPHSGEEDQLESELRILENAERLYSATERLHRMLYEGDNAVHDQLVLARNELEDLATIDPAFAESKNEAASATAIVNELAKFVQQYNSRIEFNPERLEEIRDRLGQLALLKKKYGGTLEALLQHRQTIGREYELATNFDGEIAALEQEFENQRTVCSAIAERLSSKRRETARKVNKSIVQALAALGIPNATFETVITARKSDNPRQAVVKLGRDYFEAAARGIDEVEFHVSTNVGEDPKPLVKVASGGEISRIMLALKMILAKTDRLPILVFDEIDVGVSGRIAQAVGRSLKKLSQFHQVIAITHLPQIAGVGDAHYVVEKVESQKRSTTRMRLLDLDERVAEVAKLFSGAEVTSTGIQSARELMGLERS
jgi:DNA repair protein RecN (Recombination protein N)